METPMNAVTKEELRRILSKKGLGFFLYPTEETRKAYEGIFFRRGFLNLSLVLSLLS